MLACAASVQRQMSLPLSNYLPLKSVYDKLFVKLTIVLGRPIVVGGA